jgi:RNA-directed DNA polymerase
MNPSPSAAKRAARLDLYSLRHLEVLLGHSRSELQDLAKHGIRYYDPFPHHRKERPFAKSVKSAKQRWIDNPTGPLKAIQSRIEQRVLNRVILPEHLLGGVRGKTIKDNAERHFAAKFLVTIDIKSFFPSITPHQVRSVWRETLNCSPDVAYLLTGLTTCRGYLPQGAPTSTMLANLVLSSFDEEIRTACDAHAVVYSSWVDDLAFSGEDARLVVAPVIAALKNAGFRVSHSKIKVMGPGERKVLNNLVLGRFITVQKEYIGRIRAGLYHLKRDHVPKEDRTGYIEGLLGSISYLKLFDAKKASNFVREVRSHQ